jgi:hypothetical protein
LPTQAQIDASRVVDKTVMLKAAVVDRQTRRVLNLDDVVGAVTSAGFQVTVVRLDQMTQREQLQLGMETDLLFSVHGADMSQIMYMMRGSEVIELRPYCWRVNSEFDLIASVVGVHMQHMRIRDISRVVWTCEDTCTQSLNMAACEGPEEEFLLDSMVKYQDVYADVEVVRSMAESAAHRVRMGLGAAVKSEL